MAQCIRCHREIKTNEIIFRRLDKVEFAHIHAGCLARWGGRIHRVGRWRDMRDEESQYKFLKPNPQILDDDEKAAECEAPSKVKGLEKALDRTRKIDEAEEE